MDDYDSLNHSVWECKYHVVFIPKYRRKTLFGELRSHLGEVFRTLAKQKECNIEEGHLLPDHVHMLISIPPKYSVAQMVGYIKGKSAIHIARTFFERKQNFVGHHFCCRADWLMGKRADSTMGINRMTVARAVFAMPIVESARQGSAA
ncbi:MAG: IS200/IS605 family transposase [Polyangia bacterium]